MDGQILTRNELSNIHPGEAFSLALVLSVAAVAILLVVCYKLFSSDNGSVKLPGGWSFTWK